MARKVRHCEYCGSDLGGEVEKYGPSDRITCGKQECERWARDDDAAEREEAHERLDRDMGWR